MAKNRIASPTTPQTSGTSAPPYPPSWFDRFTDWVDDLPGPAWVFYLVLGGAVVIAASAVQWKEGAYRIGTFRPLLVWTVANIAYLLGLMHYLDKSAATAMGTFRSLLVSEGASAKGSPSSQSDFATVLYRLTTLPPMPTLLAAIAGALFATGAHVIQVSMGVTPTYLAGTAGTALSTASVLIVFVPMNAIAFVLLYHTFHQLTLISDIYSRHARINIYQLQPLYALSLPGAFTAIGLIIYLYVWLAVAASASQTVGPVELGLTLSFAVIAGVTFALPLLGAHRRLVAEKNRALAVSSSLFEAATAKLHNQLGSGRYLQMDPLNKALTNLEIEQNALRRIPTWPWQPGAVRALAVALLLPVAVWAIQFFLGRLFGA